MTKNLEESVETAVREHIEAFNMHDRACLLAGLAPDVVWATGADTFHGRQALTEVFDDELWGMQPTLDVVDIVVADDRAAAQVIETLTVDGQQQRYAIAIFFRVASGLVQQVKVYREGSADIVGDVS